MQFTQTGNAHYGHSLALLIIGWDTDHVTQTQSAHAESYGGGSDPALRKDYFVAMYLISSTTLLE